MTDALAYFSEVIETENATNYRLKPLPHQTCAIQNLKSRMV
jgi:hypothetical protein